MHLNDPARPKVGERLCLVTPAGDRACAIPNLNVDLEPDGTLDVVVHTCYAPNRAQYFRFKGTTWAELATFHAAFLDSPETALAVWFGWTYATTQGDRLRAAADLADSLPAPDDIDLEDLGL